jgi:hypothetical protein
MRSALKITIDTLMKKSGLSRNEIKNLKLISTIPTIANHLAKDEESKIDLILISEKFKILWEKLAAAKEIALPREIAIGLAFEVTSILILLSQTTKSNS